MCWRLQKAVKRAIMHLYPNFAIIVQLVEHLIRNERVAGSNPVCGSNKNAGVESIPRLFYFLFLRNEMVNWGQRGVNRTLILIAEGYT